LYARNRLKIKILIFLNFDLAKGWGGFSPLSLPLVAPFPLSYVLSSVQKMYGSAHFEVGANILVLRFNYMVCFSSFEAGLRSRCDEARLQHRSFQAFFKWLQLWSCIFLSKAPAPGFWCQHMVRWVIFLG